MQYINLHGFNNRSPLVYNGLSNGYLGKQLARNADLGEGVMNRKLS